MAREPGRPAWNHKALISSWVGRGKRPPPPPADTSRVLRGQAETRPMLLRLRRTLRPGPRASTKVVKPLFQTAKLVRKVKSSYRQSESGLHQWMGATAKITALQKEWETICISKSRFQRYKAPQKAPATRAARISITLPEKIWTPP